MPSTSPTPPSICPGWAIISCEGSVTFSYLEDTSGWGSRIITRIAGEWAGGDIDHDGTPDAVAAVVCSDGDRQFWQLVALTARAGGIRTIGLILAIASPPAPTMLFGARVTPGGDVVVAVGDHFGRSEGETERISQYQERTYRWNGSQFAQVDGPTAFPPNPHMYDLEVRLANLAFGSPAGGARAANLTVTIGNNGPGPAGSVTVILGYPGYARPGTGGDWALCHPPNPLAAPTIVSCDIGVIGAGTNRTLTLPFTGPAVAPPASPDGRITCIVFGYDAMGYGYQLNPAQNRLPITVSFE